MSTPPTLHLRPLYSQLTVSVLVASSGSVVAGLVALHLYSAPLSSGARMNEICFETMFPVTRCEPWISLSPTNEHRPKLSGCRTSDESESPQILAYVATKENNRWLFRVTLVVLLEFCPKILGGGRDLQIMVLLKKECSFSGADSMG